ncbi:MAG: DNA repair protein RecO [Chloroflexi bacterium]|jgi:DNA repair protein RecO (recombination protein O)|nr:DNA repair protein RecO [Chloroflexota bacterium]
MPTPKTYKTEAIVLKHIDLGEADRIITLYTPNLGKIRAVAKGVRRAKSRLGGHVEPLTNCSLMLSRGRNLEIVSQGQIIESFLSIRNDLQRTAQALYLIELTDAFTSERVENYPVYRLLIDSLHLLSRVPNVELLFRFFELQLLEHMGYRPQLYECLNCKVPLAPVENYFSASGGGVLCPNCAHTEPLVHPLSVDALKVMRLMQRGDYSVASRLRLNSGLSLELERAIKGYVRYLLERDVKSARFLDRLKKDAAEMGVA